jgi:isoquinoline 1-oxidoreductase subunit beta
MADNTRETLLLNVNGKSVRLPASAADEPLLWALRDRLDLKGTKFSCGHGGCGACMIESDGEAVTSCNHPVEEFAGKQITTIEGIAVQPGDPVIRAWLIEQVPQCGYCQPGMVVAAHALLAHDPQPSDAAIDAAMSHVLCRCGTYPRVRRAIHRAACRDWANAPFPDEALAAPRRPPADVIVFNPWVNIARDGTVIVIIGQSEMGQGITTALAMLVAEELDVPLSRVVTKFGPADHVYDNPILHMQMTVGSLSIKTNWERVRRAGAEVRERLISAAAASWQVPREQCHAEAGEIVHKPTARRLRYGELAAAATALPAPKNPSLKSFDAFTLLGRPTARLDIPDHAAGRTVFGIDVTVPGVLAATMLMPPIVGGRLDHVDDTKAKSIPGVQDVVRIPSGLAVIADDFASAFRGRDSLVASWTGGLQGLSSTQISSRFRQAAARPGKELQSRGDALHALEGAARVIEAEYETPYLAHATMEPMNCTARIANGRCEIWVPTQSPTLAQQAGAQAAGLPLDKVEVHSTFLGGGFGRRSVPDVVTQAVEIAKATGRAIHLLWPRIEDTHHDHYRPANLNALRGGLDKAGNPIAWFQRVVGPALAGEGLDIPYDFAHLRSEHVEDDPGIPTGYWRSVGASQNAFAVEGFMDELAGAAGIDPLAFRLRCLSKAPRHRHVLERVRDMAGWNSPPPSGCARGIALYYAHGGWVAQIAEVSLTSERKIKVHHVWCAVDCGFAINPDTLTAQIEGGIVFGLTATLHGAITIEDGRLQQSGFRDYPLLTMAETPIIDVYVMPSREAPSGAGECAVPPIAPAVANAVFVATGTRLRRLPLRLP